MDLGETILDHYNQFLGDYIGTDVYTNGDYEIQILGFPNAIKDCLVLTSFGLSNHACQGDCCEVILPVDDLYDESAEIFANSLFYALSNNMNIGRGLLIEVLKDFLRNAVKQPCISPTFMFCLKDLHSSIHAIFIWDSSFLKKNQNILPIWDILPLKASI